MVRGEPAGSGQSRTRAFLTRTVEFGGGGSRPAEGVVEGACALRRGDPSGVVLEGPVAAGRLAGMGLRLS